MCLFSGPVSTVSDTQIFARTLPSTDESEDLQALVYAMSYSTTEELAMILPLPTPPGVSEQAVRFLDFSAYEDFFEDLFSPFQESADRSELKSFALGTARLVVHEVGSYEASFVPSLSDFSRLDPRFRLDDGIWAELPDYSDYGFAVFKLKPGAKTVHPMALQFPRRADQGLFFPTVHVHDGKVPKKAEFHHTLFCQSPQKHRFWKTSKIPAREFVNAEETMGVVDGDLVVQKRDFRGQFLNQDIVLPA